MENTSKLVVSYNICFQAMCHENSGTAAALGASCGWIVPGELTICARNMAHFMDGVLATTGGRNFDFVGFQEANNSDHLQNAAVKSLIHLTRLHHKSTPKHGKGMHMSSFYDASKYSLVDSAMSAFKTENEDRPFHILILSETATGEKIIFINVHAPHGWDENKSYPNHSYSELDSIGHDLSQVALKMPYFNPATNYKIIMTGDFNESGWKEIQVAKGTFTWKPLQMAGVETEVGLTNFIYSCTKDDGCWHKADAHKGGDYVFASGQAATIYVPSNYPFAPAGACGDATQMDTIWQSDHLPVMAELV